MGAGAKTQTGFGRLIVDEIQRKKLEEKLKEQQKQQAKANATVEQQLMLEASEILQASPAPTLMAGQTNAVKIDALLKKTQGWSEADCAAVWSNVVIPWLAKAYPDKKKAKEQSKKRTEKNTWLKAPAV
jgi:predicted RNase H-like nuclease